MYQRRKVDVIAKFKIIRSIYDKLFITIGGSLWIFSTLWDIYKLQRYWLDYSIEFYSSFLIFCMIIYSINPKALPTIIYNSFKIITTIRGRGTLLIIISSLFLKDKHTFHKFCAILLFFGGIIYFICEILVPTTKEELQQIDAIYNNNNNSNKKNNINYSNINNNIQKSNANNTSTIQTDQSTVIFKNNNNDNNNIMDNNNRTKSNDINEKDESNNNALTPNQNEKEENNKNEKNNIEDEIIRKTDNPYEIPEDF